MARAWGWLSLVAGWLPVGALFALLIVSAHGISTHDAILSALRMMAAAAILGLGVYRLTARLPWPHPFRLRFIGAHLLAAAAYAAAWTLLNSLIESALRAQLVLVLGPGLVSYLILGVWLYVMVAGVAYAIRAAERGAQVETLAARAQLAALRSQLHPHFLFNALNTVMHLIPTDPRRAVHAAEQLAAALRTVLEEQRDILRLDEEWRFVQSYLAIECIRFGDRLTLKVDIDAAAWACLLPSFALQTLVENAVRHAAAPRVEPTMLVVSARLDGDQLELRVSDDGPGASAQAIANSPGSGLRRLRERLHWLYGSRASLHTGAGDAGGLCVTLRVAQVAAVAADDADD